MLRLSQNEKQSFGSHVRRQLLPTIVTLTVTLTLNCPVNILNLLYHGKICPISTKPETNISIKSKAWNTAINFDMGRISHFLAHNRQLLRWLQMLFRSLTSGFLWSQWRGKLSRHSRRMHNPQFHVSGKRPIDLSGSLFWHSWNLGIFWCKVHGRILYTDDYLRHARKTFSSCSPRLPLFDIEFRKMIPFYWYCKLFGVCQLQNM